MHRRHQQRGRNSFAADVPHSEHHTFVGQRNEVVVVTANRARRPADAVHLQRGQIASSRGKSSTCTSCAMASSFSMRCLSFCSATRRRQRCGHGVKRLLQRRHLVARLAAVMRCVRSPRFTLSRRFVEFIHRLGHAARQPHADDQGDEFDHAEEDGDDSASIEMKILDFSPSLPNRTLYSCDGRVLTISAPVRSVSSCQSVALNKVQKWNSRSKPAGGWRHASGFHVCGAVHSVDCPQKFTFEAIAADIDG